jgi:hypothetical protein
VRRKDLSCAIKKSNQRRCNRDLPSRYLTREALSNFQENKFRCHRSHPIRQRSRSPPPVSPPSCRGWGSETARSVPQGGRQPCSEPFGQESS